VALGLAAALAAICASEASGAPALSYGCSPPLPATAANCYPWHTGPVKLAWDWNQTLAQPIPPGTCTIQTFSQDTAGLPVSCEVQDLFDQSTTKLTAVIRIDATPPSVVGVEPAREPDHDGWWNHPVAFAFDGTDATSGIAACDVVTYDGPDGAEAKVSGSCRDRAGNATTRGFSVRYDATPPSLSGLTAAPGNRSVTLSWTVSPDAVVSEVARAPGVGGAASSTLQAGTADTFRDTEVTNGTTYRYTVSAADAAGNVASATASVTPSVKYALAPGHNARLRRPPVLRWPPVDRARYYNVQLFRGKHKVLSRWPTAHHLRLHRSWTFHGRRYRLKPGRYRWFVWPGFGARAAHRYGPMIAQQSFTFER
jgi:hypothetical protein